MQLGEQVVGGVGRQRHSQSGPLQRHRRVEGAHAAVADLRRDEEPESQFYHFYFTPPLHLAQ